MAKSAVKHHIPTVSIKSNYNVDGCFNITGDLYVNGTKIEPGKNVSSSNSINGLTGDINIEGKDGISVVTEYGKIVVKLDDAFQLVKTRVDELTNVVLNDESGLTKRLEAIEDKKYDESIDTIQNTLSSLQKDIEDLKEETGDISSEEILELINRVSDIETNVNSLLAIDIEAKVAEAVKTQLDEIDLDERLSSIESRISKLEETIEPSEPEEPEEEPEESGYKYGRSFSTLSDLHAAKNTLQEKYIYFVTDKNTTEQYIIEEGNIKQVSGNFNIIIDGNINDTEEVSPLYNTTGREIDFNMPELVDGDFLYKNCHQLEIFTSDTPALETGVQMFYNTSLFSFNGILSSLTDGRQMFWGCKLDEDSVLNIVDSINDLSSDKKEEHHITIGVNKSVLDDDFISEMNEEMIEKGWIVEWRDETNAIINL